MTGEEGPDVAAPPKAWGPAGCALCHHVVVGRITCFEKYVAL